MYIYICTYIHSIERERDNVYIYICIYTHTYIIRIYPAPCRRRSRSGGGCLVGPPGRPNRMHVSIYVCMYACMYVCMHVGM